MATTPEYLNFVDSTAFEQWAEGTGPYAPGTLTPGPCLQILKAACLGMFSNATEGPIFKRLDATQPFLLCVPGAPNCTISSNAVVGEGVYTGQVFGFNPSIYPVPVYGTLLVPGPSETNQLTVEKANGELATYDPRRLTGVSVYQEIDLKFSVGDRVQFTAPDKSLGVANRDLAVIESIAPDGRVTARLDNNRQIEFNAGHHRHFDHGYAVTSHSSQGLTAERVLVHADTSVHPDLLNSRFGYVAISRASHEATLFTDDMAKLGCRLEADVSKTSALDISQASSVRQGIGLGI